MERGAARRILLVGATGVFGRRLAPQLARIPGSALTVTSRDLARAESFAAQLRIETGVETVDALAFEKRRHLQDIKRIAPFLVIDVSGPFQGADYSLARASLETGAHFIDLADARDHVLGFAAALDDLARGKNLVALTGASSTPALSCAAAEELTRGWRRIDAVESAIAPGGAADVGANVIEAILTYAGRPIPIWREGKTQTVRGWGSAERWLFPGLGKRWLSPVETPDAELFPEHFHVTGGVRFLAGLESHLEHFGLLALAWLPGGVPRPRSLTKLLHAARRLTRPFCGDKGAMLVRVEGLDAQGVATRAQWSLIAEDNDGPNIPTLAALACAKALFQGKIASGARPCLGIVTLADIESEMSPFAITTRRERVSQN